MDGLFSHPAREEKCAQAPQHLARIPPCRQNPLEVTQIRHPHGHLWEALLCQEQPQAPHRPFPAAALAVAPVQPCGAAPGPRVPNSSVILGTFSSEWPQEGPQELRHGSVLPLQNSGSSSTQLSPLDEQQQRQQQPRRPERVLLRWHCTVLAQELRQGRAGGCSILVPRVTVSDGRCSARCRGSPQPLLRTPHSGEQPKDSGSDKAVLGSGRFSEALRDLLLNTEPLPDSAPALPEGPSSSPPANGQVSIHWLHQRGFFGIESPPITFFTSWDWKEIVAWPLTLKGRGSGTCRCGPIHGDPEAEPLTWKGRLSPIAAVTDPLWPPWAPGCSGRGRSINQSAGTPETTDKSQVKAVPPLPAGTPSLSCEPQRHDTKRKVK